MCAISSSIVQAQNTVTILDKDSSALTQAMVTIQQGEQVQSLFPNDQGVVHFPFVNGKLLLYVQCYGYQSLTDTFYRSGINKTYILEKLEFYTPPIVITGGKREKEVESLHKVKVIKGKDLIKQGRTNLKDALETTANVQISQDGVLGSGLSLQGISGQGVKVLIDGVPMIGRQNGNIDLSQIDLTNVDRIEIIEGPMSVLYGADALGGVINIITKVPNKGSRANLNVYNDNVGQHNVTGMLTAGITNHISASFSGGRKFFAGLDYVDSTRSQDWKPKTQYFGEGNLFLRYKKHQHRLRSRGYNEKLTVRSNANYEIYTITGFNSLFYTDRWDYEHFSTFNLKNQAKIRFQNTYNTYSRRKEEYLRDLVSGNETLLPEEYQDTTTFNQLQSRLYYFTNNKKKLNAMVGMEFTNLIGTGTKIVEGDQSSTEMALFSSFVYQHKNWKVNPGLRILHQSNFGKDIGLGGIKIAPLVPSLHLMKVVKKNGNLRISLAQGYRAPSIKEMHFQFVDRNHNIVGNESLQPEESMHYGIQWESRKMKNKGLLKFNSGLFYNDVQNQIQLVLTDAQNNSYSYRNIGNINTYGGQLGLHLARPSWRASVNTSLNALNVKEGETKWNGQVIGIFTFRIKPAKMSLNLNYKYNGPSYGFNDDLTFYKLEAYDLLDLAASKSLLSQRMMLSVGIRNLFNVTQLNSSGNSTQGHASASGNVSMGMGRTYYINCSFAFDFAKDKKEDRNE